MRIDYYPEHDQAMIYLREIEEGGVGETVPGWPGTQAFGINLDFDHEGRLVGIDVTGASHKLPPEFLATARRL